MGKGRRNYDGIPEQTDFPVLPDGNYMFEIIEVEDSYTKENHDFMAKIVLRCIEEGDYEGNKVFDNIIIPERTSPAHKIIGRTKRFLHAIDEPYQGDFEYDTDNWIGKTVEAKISIGSWNNKPKNDVDRYLLNEDQQKQEPNKNVNRGSQWSDNDQDLPF